MEHHKYAVVTGATQGIGKAVAEKLLSEGFSVAICARNEADLDELNATWKIQYPAAAILTEVADFSRKNEVLAFAQRVLQTFPAIHVLVNNAGIFQPGNLADEPEGQLEAMMDVNLYSAYHFTRAMLPTMKKKRTGHIFNMCSIASLKAYANGGAYSISKYALMGFSENLREELKPDNIRVTAICPGATWTRSWSSSGIDETRIMEASDVAEMVWSAYKLSASANVETIVMRPQQGDL